MQPLLGPGEGCGLRHLIVATYSDYLAEATDLAVPEFVRAPRRPIERPGVVPGARCWRAAFVPDRWQRAPTTWR